MNKRAIVISHLSIITLNVHGLNYSMKRSRVAELIKKLRPSYMLPKRQTLTTDRVKVTGWKETYHEIS